MINACICGGGGGNVSGNIVLQFDGSQQWRYL